MAPRGVAAPFQAILADRAQQRASLDPAGADVPYRARSRRLLAAVLQCAVAVRSSGRHALRPFAAAVARMPGRAGHDAGPQRPSQTPARGHPVDMSLTPAQHRALTWLGLGAAVVLMLWVLGSSLTPILLSLVFAYLVWPMVRLLERRGMPRALGATVTICVAMLAVTVLVLLLVPIVTTLLPLLRTQWPTLLDNFNRVVSPRLETWGIVIDTDTVKAWILKSADGNMEEWGQKLLSSARIGGSWLVTIVGFLVLVPVLAFYLLVDAERVTAGAWSLVPLKSRDGLASFLRECDNMLRQYLKGQLSVMGAMALIYPLGLMLTGLNLAWPIGVFTGLAVFIPYLGYTTGLVLALMSAAIQFSSWHGVVAVGAAYAVGQVLESFVLTPRLVGGRIGLSPLAVILALLIFGEVLGFVGVLVCLPVSALLVVGVRHALAAYRASAFYRT